FDVLPGDGIVGSNGAFDVAAGDPADSGAWIDVGGLTDGTVEVDAGETRVLPVTVRVPADATPGDHPAGIVVAVASEADGVSVKQRIGVRLHLQVSGELAAGLELVDVDRSFTPSLVPFAPGTLR